MAKIRSLDLIAAKWSRVASASGTSYEEGVKNPTGDYAAGAIAANGSWKAGVQAAAGRDAYAAGVRRAGNEKWQRNASAKGPARYGQGVQVALPDYSAGFAAYHQVIASTQLPPRGPRRSPQNLARVAAIAQALAAKKEALSRGSAG
jgi:hypothetical protein